MPHVVRWYISAKHFVCQASVHFCTEFRTLCVMSVQQTVAMTGGNGSNETFCTSVNKISNLSVHLCCEAIDVCFREYTRTLECVV